MRIGKEKTEKILIQKIKRQEYALAFYRRKLAFLKTMESRMFTEGIDMFFSEVNYRLFMHEKDFIQNHLILLTTQKINKLCEKYERLTGKKYEEGQVQQENS